MEDYKYGDNLSLLEAGDPTLTRPGRRKKGQEPENSEDDVLREIQVDTEEDNSEDQDQEPTPPDVPSNTPVTVQRSLPYQHQAPPAYSAQGHSNSNQQPHITQHATNHSTLQIPPTPTPPATVLLMYSGPKVFSGDSGTENPAQWMQDFQRHAMSVGWDDAKMATAFPLYLKVGSTAKAWHEGLRKQNPPVDSTKFKDVAAAFRICWPPDKTIKVTKTQLRDWVLARILTEEEVGQSVEEGSVWIGKHVIFAKDIRRLAAAADDTNMALWLSVRDRLPAALREVTADKDYDSWQEFVEDMAKISPESLQRKKRSLENEALVEQLRAQMEGRGAAPSFSYVHFLELCSLPAQHNSSQQRRPHQDICTHHRRRHLCQQHQHRRWWV